MGIYRTGKDKDAVVVKGLKYHFWFAIRFALFGWYMIPAMVLLASTMGVIMSGGEFKETFSMAKTMTKDVFYGDTGWIESL